MSSPQTHIQSEYSLNEIAINSYKIEIKKETIENTTNEIISYVKVTHDTSITDKQADKKVIPHYSCKGE